MKNYHDIKDLSLYHFKACPFCAWTRGQISKLGLDIEQRDIRLNPQYRQQLIQGGGKSQVPSLKIDYKNGETRWLYESQDIVNYLARYQQHLGNVA